MKLTAVIATLVAAVAAQDAYIYRPTSGLTFAAGQDVTVSFVQPSSLTSLVQLGIGIAIRHCNTDPCDSNEGYLGTLLYAGPYNPQYGGIPQGGLNETFTVTIPSYIASGPAVLSVAHASFLGASTYFLTEVVNVTLNIE